MPIYATTEELRRRLNTSGGGGAGADDVLLLELLEAASGRVAALARDRQLEPLPALEGDPPADTADPVARSFPVFGALVQVPDLRVVETVTLGETELAAEPGGYRLRTPVGEAADLRYLHVRLRGYGWGSYGPGELSPGEPPELTIVGRWGPTAVEPFVRDAVLTWAARAWHARAARFADAVQDPAGGIAASYFRAVPADVAVALDRLKVPGL